MNLTYIFFWLAWSVVLATGCIYAVYKIIYWLKEIDTKLNTIVRGEGEIWSDGFMSAEVMRKAANSMEKRGKNR